MTVMKIVTILGTTLLLLIEPGLGLTLDVPSSEHHPRMLRFTSKQARNGRSNKPAGGNGSKGAVDSEKGHMEGVDSARGSNTAEGGRGGGGSGKGSKGAVDSGKGGKGAVDSGKGGKGEVDSGEGSKGGGHSGKGSKGGVDSGRESKGEGGSGKGSKGGVDSGRGSKGEGGSGKGSKGAVDSGKGSKGGVDSGRGSKGEGGSGKGSKGGDDSGKRSEGDGVSGEVSTGEGNSGKGNTGGVDSGRGSNLQGNSGKRSKEAVDNGKRGKGAGDSENGSKRGDGSGKGSKGDGRHGKGGLSKAELPTKTEVAASSTLSVLPSAPPRSPTSNTDDDDNGLSIGDKGVVGSGEVSKKGEGGRGKGSKEADERSAKGSKEGGADSGKRSKGGGGSGKGSKGAVDSGKGSKGEGCSKKASNGGGDSGKRSKGGGASAKGGKGGCTHGEGDPSTTASPMRTGVTASPILSAPPSGAPAISELPTSNTDDDGNGTPIVCDDPPVVVFSTPFAVNADNLIDLNLLDPALNQFYEEVKIFEEFGILNEDIDFLGSSINSLIGREGRSGIAASLDLRNFVDDTAARHGSSFVNASDLATELACSVSADKVFSHSSQFCGDGVPDYPVTVKSEGDDIIVVTFCVGMTFARSTTLNGYGLLSSRGQCIELETASKVSVTSSLKFSARLTISTSAPQQPLIEIGLTEASVELMESRPDVELYVGLLGLNCSSERTSATASAKFALSYCNGTCDEQVIGRQVNSAHPYYLQATGKYDIHGDCVLLDMFPGIEDDFAVSFNIIAEEIYAPEVNVILDPPRNFRIDDFTKFCPSDVPYLLRTLDSTFGWTMGNEEMQTLVPFTSTSLKNTLAPETKLVEQLLLHFLKVQDFDRRVTRSLSLVESDGKPGKPGEPDEPNTDQIRFLPANETLEFLFITSDLNVDTGDVDALRKLAKVNGGACELVTPKIETMSRGEFQTFLKDSINAACSVTACDLSDCRRSNEDIDLSDCCFDEDTDDYLCSENPSCDIIVGIIEVSQDNKAAGQNRVVLASVGSKDVSFIGLYFDKKRKEPFTKEFAFPLNLPVSPGFVPRFRTFNDLARRIKLAISGKNNTDVKADFKYELEPSQFSISVEFNRTIQENVGFRPRKMRLVISSL
jgi:hypothetical protein